MTSYRMLMGERGARINMGPVILIWAATGGIGSFALQCALKSDAIPGIPGGGSRRQR